VPGVDDFLLCVAGFVQPDSARLGGIVDGAAQEAASRR
jgi:hypothetical protein